MFYIISFVAALALAVLLQQAEPEIPSVVQALIPALTIAINFLVAKTELGKQFGKRNITAVVSVILAPVALYLLGESLPTWPVHDGDVPAWLAAVQLFMLALWGLVLSFWKLQQVLHDLLNGQAGMPDAIAERLMRL